MDYDKLRETIYGLILGTIVCAMISMCTSCSHTKYVSVPEYHEVYINKTDTLLHKDSVYVHDSLYVATSRDTTYITRYHTEYRDHLVYRNTTDTILKTDSISVPYEIVKPNSALHTFTYNMGILAMIVLLCALLGFIAKKIITRR